MSRPIDEKIVSMKMENSDFKKKVKETLQSFATMNKGLKDIGKGDFSGLEENISKIESRFSGSGVVIATMLQRLTNKAIDMGHQMAQAIFNPLIEGGRKRALNIEQAKFQFEGLGMDVEQAMDDALFAVKGTAYGLDEAAVAASQFGASGIALGDEMKNALRGISGVAAMSGRGFSDVSNIFTKVAGQGRLMGDDLNRLGASGINAAATLGKAFGKSEQDIRKMVSNGAISFKMFSEAMSEAFGEHATRASETYTGSLSNMNAAIARIGAAIATPDFEDKRKLFNALTPLIDQVAAALMPLIEVWAEFNSMRNDKLIAFIESINIQKFTDLGVAANLAKAFFNVLTAGSTIMGAITDGFKAMMGVAGGGGGGFTWVVVKLSEALVGMTNIFVLGAKGVNALSKVFQGIFSIFGTVWILIKELAKAIANLIPEFESSGNGVLGFAETLAGLAIMMHQSFVEGNFITDMIRTMGKGFKEVSIIVGNFGDAIAEVWNILFKGNFLGTGPWDEDSKIVDWLFKIREAFQITFAYLASIKMSDIGAGIMDFFSFVGGAISTAIDGIKSFGSAVAEHWPSGTTIMGGGFIAALVTIAGFVLKLGWDFIRSFKSWATLGSSLEDLFGGLEDLLGDVGGALNAFALEVKSKALVNVAIAVGILAVSFWALSKLDAKQITHGLIAIMGSMTAVVGALAVMDKWEIAGDSMKRAVMIVALSIAIGVMASALHKISDLNWKQVGVGLVGLTGSLLALSASVAIMSKFGGDGKATTSALQLAAIAGVTYILAVSLEKIAMIKPERLTPSVIALSALLLAFTGGVTLMSRFSDGKKVSASALQLLSVAGAIYLLIKSIKQLGDMWVESPEVLVAGMASVAILLVAIGGFAKLTSTNDLLKTSTGIAILAGALLLLIYPIKQFGDLAKNDFGTLAAGLGAIAGVMVTIGLASKAMGGIFVASLGMTVLAGALTLLMIPITAMGALNLGHIAKGVIGLAGAILLIGGAATLLGLAGPALAIGAGGIALLSIALLAAGLGMSLFATGIVTLATMTAAAITSIVATLGALIVGVSTLIPQAIEFVGNLILAMSAKIREVSPILAQDFLDTLTEIATKFEEGAPVIYEKFMNMALGLVDTWAEYMPQLVDSVGDGLVGMIEAIGDRVGDFIDAGTGIITGFLEGVSRSNQEVINTAMEVVVDFVEGMSESVRKNGPELTDAFVALMGNVILVVIDAGIKTINALFGWIPGVKDATAEIGKTAESYIEENFGAEALAKEKGEGFAKELDKTENKVAKAAENIATAAEDKLDVDTSTLGGDFSSGFAGGIESQGALRKVASAASSLASKAWGTVKGWLKISSPSRVTREGGGWFGEGFALGIRDKVRDVANSAKGLATQATDSLNQFMEGFELPEDDYEIHFKAVIDYEGFNPNRFGKIDPIALQPITETTRGLVAMTDGELRQNRDISMQDRTDEVVRAIRESSDDDDVKVLLQDISNGIKDGKVIYMDSTKVSSAVEPHIDRMQKQRMIKEQRAQGVMT